MYKYVLYWPFWDCMPVMSLNTDYKDNALDVGAYVTSGALQ